MAKWNEIESSPAYAALPDDRKASVKARYFDTVIAPSAPPERVSVLRSKFLGATVQPVAQESAATQSPGRPVDRSISTLGATQQSQQFERMSRDDGTGTVADPFRPSGLFRRSHADVFEEAPSGSWVRMEDGSLQKRETSVGEAVANIPARIVGVGASAIKGIGDLVSDYTKARDESYAKVLRDTGRSEESVQNVESQTAAQRETGLNSAFMALADQLHDASKERMEQRSPNTTIQDVYQDPLKNTLPFIAETSLHSAGDMMMAMNPVTLPALATGLSNEIAETRMENDGRSGRPSVSDRVIGAVGGVAQSGLESFGMGRLLKPVSESAQNLVAPLVRETLGEAVKRTGKETAVQAGQEAVEEGIGYATETVGTKRGASLTDFRDAVVSGALAGGGLGAVVQAGKEAINAMSSGNTPPPAGAATPTVPPSTPAPTQSTPMVQPVAVPTAPAPIQQGEDLLNGGTVADQMAASTQSITPSPAPDAQPISAAEAQEAAIVRGAELEAKEVDGNITADESAELDALRQNIDNVGMLAAMMGRKLEAQATATPVTPDPVQPEPVQPVQQDIAPTAPVVTPAPEVVVDDVPKTGLSALIEAQKEVDPESVEGAYAPEVSARQAEAEARIREIDSTPPHKEEDFYDQVESEIGWDQQGGRALRTYAGWEKEGEDAQGDVVDRTKWVPKPGINGLSDFWSKRSYVDNAQPISEKDARKALTKWREGKKLGAREQRFVDYFRKSAKEYADELNQNRAEYLEQLKAVRDEEPALLVSLWESMKIDAAPIAPEDENEALTLMELVSRAHRSGADAKQIESVESIGDAPKKAARLWRIIKDNEAKENGPDARAEIGADTRGDSQGERGPTVSPRGNPAEAGTSSRGEGEATAAEESKPLGLIPALTLAAQQPTQPEATKPASVQTSMFAPPTRGEQMKAAEREKDNQRNGKNSTGRTDMMAGDGELFAGPRPEQLDVEQEASKVSAAAAEAATSPANDKPEPTDAQKKAGNYAKGHITLHGLGISIENPAGTRRRPEWPALAHHYGYFKGTEGKDGDHVDVFLGPDAENAELPVFVVDQINKSGRFDEHKVMLGFPDEASARAGYLANYTPGWNGLGDITQMSLPDFKSWVSDPARTTKRASADKAAAKKAPPKVTPQIPSSRQLGDMIMVAADSIDKLRKSDVDRVLSEAPAHFRLALSMHISQKRPDLAAEVREVMDETSADQQSESKLDQETAQVDSESASQAATYENAKAIRDAAEERVKAASDAMQKYPRGAMGLTPDDVKASPKWKADKAELDAAMSDLKNANATIAKHFAKESSAERDARREAKASKSKPDQETLPPGAPAQQEAKQASEFNAQAAWDAMTPAARGAMLDKWAGAGQTDMGERYKSRAWGSFNAGEKDTLAALLKAAQETAADDIDSTVKDSLPVEKSTADMTRAEGKTTAAEPKAEPAQTASKTPNVDAHNTAIAALNDGSLTVDQYRAAFESVLSGEQAIKEELAGKTKDALLDMLSPMLQSRYRGDKKADVVNVVYSEMISDYALRGFSWGMSSGSREAAIRNLVESETAETLAAYAEGLKSARAERAKETAAREESIADPKTLDDFRLFIRNARLQDRTYQEAYLMLTPEQRAKYDALEAESTREAREERQRKAKTEVRAAGQATDGQIIEAMHTRDHYPLFVVQLSDRLSADDYRTVLAGAKKLGGWYSKFSGNGAVPGFQFKDRAAAEAFVKLAGGDTSAVESAAEQRRDAFDDDRSQSAVERLREMADRLDESAESVINSSRKTNTARRAAFAASALNSAEADKALAKTMRNIASAIESGTAKFLNMVRTKSQVELLRGTVRAAKDNELRAKYSSYADQEKHKGQPATDETAGFAEFPAYTAFRSDLASLARQMLEVDGLKKLGQQLMTVADDVTDAYIEFAKQPANLYRVSSFAMRRGDDVSAAVFKSKDDAEKAIKRSGLVGKAIVLPVKRGDNRVVMSPSEAINQGIWTGDGDKRITLTPAGGEMLVEAIGRRGNKTNKLTVPWQFQNAYDRRKALSRIGIETPAEFRSALREFIGLQAQATANKVREMELAMVGRKNDGLDFFPTPEHVADQMIEAAEIQAGMRVLEPSAGMGHIADRIREAGSEPDVIEMAGERRELLEAKGYEVAGDDFMSFESDQAYDRIVMNPPFSNRRDAEHVRHAYGLLKPGGRIVAIMGEGVFFGQDKKAQDFREWLEDVGGTSEKLPPGSFMDPSLPVNTGVSARMLVIDKAASDVMLSRPALEPITAAAEQILETLRIDSESDPYADYGLRVIPGDFNGDVSIGDILPPSNKWDDGEDTGEELAGTSAISIKQPTISDIRNALRLTGADGGEGGPNGFYFGDRVALVKGDKKGSGDDVGEIILKDAVVVGMWKKTSKGSSSIQPNYQSVKPYAADTINVDGVDRPRTNSNGQPIHDTDEGLRNFWRWFSPSPGQLLDGLSVSEISGLKRDTEALADFIESQTGLSESDRFAVVPTSVFAHVAGAVGNDKILNAVIGSIPVDVMNFLGGEQSAAKNVLHDAAMLEKVLSVDPASDVPLGVKPSGIAELLVRVVANAGAKISGLASGALERNAAMLADTNDPVLGAHVRKSPNNDLGIIAGFGDSKVVDDQGRPLVVYHGTNADFSEFSANRGYTPGFWFATNADDAASVSSGGYVITAYLRVKNLTTLADLARARRDNSGVESVVERNAAVVSQLERAGFDGINDERFAGVGGKGKEVWAVFNANQIKSATGNSGDFSPDDARITHSRAADPVVLSGEDAKRSALRDVLDGWDGDVPAVELLGSHEGIPLQYRDPDGHWKTAEGFFADGKVFVVLGSNRDATRAVEVLRHEAVGHYGVERVLGGEWDGLVKGIADVRTGRKGLLSSAEWKAVIRDTAIRYPDFVSGDKKAFAKEVLAVAAERGITGGIMDRIIAKVRQFLRRLGLIDGSYSEAEARDVLRRALKTVTEGSQDASTEYVQLHQMSTPDRSEAASKVADILRMMAESDNEPMFRYKESGALDMPSVFKDIAGESVRVSMSGEVMQNFEQNVPGVRSREVPAEKWSLRSVDGKQMDVYVESDHSGVRGSGRRLFLDASYGDPGKSMGSVIYAALFQFALNNNMVFIGDPSSLSDAALLRRTEHMLSAAIKHGTTRMMEPHPRQMEPANKKYGVSHTWVTPLKWTIGDDAANIAAMLDTSTRNTMKLLRGTDANGYVYSLSERRMLDAGGEVVARERLVDLASKATATLKANIKASGGKPNAAVVGDTTVARAISVQSLIRQQQGRSSLLAEIAGRLSSAGIDSDPLYRAFYSASAPTFYSAMLQAVEAGKGAPKRADATAWMQWLDGAARRGEIKADERYWLGVDEWLDSQQGPITREALADFVRANGVQVTETVLGETSEAEIQRKIDAINDEYNAILGDRSIADLSTDERGKINKLIAEHDRLADEELRNARDSYIPAKFDQYQLPGGTNYREVLLTLPSEQVPFDLQWEQQTDDMLSAALPSGRLALVIYDSQAPENGATLNTTDQDGESATPEVQYPSVEAAKAAARAMVTSRNEDRPGYRSSHWDQPNVLAHIRVNDRVDADGKRVLFVEEIQSDWGQDGKKKGFDTGDTTPRGWSDTGQAKQGNIPSAPFVTATDKWLTLALKRVLRMAVDGGYDKVAFVNGQQSTDRYWGHEAVRPAIERWNAVSKPEGIRELGENVLGRKMYPLVPLDHMDTGVLPMLKHDQVVDAVVSRIPVDVVNVLARHGLTAEQLACNGDVVFDALTVDDRSRAASALGAAIGQTGATIRAKLEVLGSTRADVQLLPALRASDLDSREVLGVVSPGTIFHGIGGSLPKESAAARTIAEPAPGKQGRWVEQKLGTAEIAELLNGHVEAKHGREGLLQHSVEPPPGQGMIAFYDKIVPAAVKDLLKKVGGGQMESVEIAQGNDYVDKSARSTQTGFTINAAMRQKVSAGLPLFSRSQPQVIPPVQPASPGVPTQGTMPQAVAARGKIADLTSPESFDRLIYEFQDKFIDLRRVQDRITELGGAINDINDAYLGEELFHARLAKRTQNFLRDELKPLLASLKSAGITIAEFETFLHARHAPEANAVLADRNPNQATIDQARATALAAVKSLELQLQTAQVQGTSVKAINDALDTAREDLTRWNRAQAFRGTEAERLSLSGMTDADAAAHMAAIDPGKRVTLDALAAKIDAMQSKTLDTLVSYGLMDKASIDAWRQTYKYYIPLHRDEAHPDSVAHPTGSGFNVRGDASRGRTGSNEKVTHILSHIAMQREAALTRGEKNHVVKKLYLMATQNKDPDFWTVDTPLTSKIVDPSTGFVREQVDPLFKSRPHVVMLRIAGKDRAIVFNEHNKRAVRLAHSLKNLDVDDLHYVLGAAAKATRWFASVNTQYNPVFGFLNLWRDAQSAVLNLSSTALRGKQAAVMARILPAMRAIYRERRGKAAVDPRLSRLWEEMQIEGGVTGYRDLFRDAGERAKAIDSELRSMDRGKVSKVAHAIVDWLDHYNTALENAVRLAAYDVALSQGMSKPRAASTAKNLTVNFNRKGRQTREVGALYAFFNASVQGNARTLQTLTGPAGKAIVAGGIGIGFVSSMLAAAFMGDDDYEKIPDFVRERSLVIPIGGGKYLSWPYPLGFHVLPNLGRIAAEMMMGVKKPMDGYVDTMMIAADTFSPLGSASGGPAQMLSPTALDPAVALMQNSDWTGMPIYREDFNSLDPTPGHTRAKDSASLPAKVLSEFANWATGGNDYEPGRLSPTPDQIDFITGQITGGLGREILKAMQVLQAPFSDDELPLHKVPLVGRIIGSTRGQSGEAGRFYSAIRELNVLDRELEGRIESGDDPQGFMQENPQTNLIEFGKASYNQVKKLRKLRDQLSEAGAERDRINAVNDQITETMAALNKAMSEAD